MCSRLAEHYDCIKFLVEAQNYTYTDVAVHLMAQFGNEVSCRTIRRFCKQHDIRTRRTSDEELANSIQTAICEVGPSYGRKMMAGYLRSKGVNAAERRVGQILKTMNEPYHAARRQGVRNMNPIPYHAEYFGHKLHLDQNEKLAMFGVTSVLAIDGYSGKIVAWSTMPKKNNLVIYQNVYRKAILENGMFDQVRVDHGTEFHLILYIQEINADLRTNTNRQPYIQTQSKQNHRIERIWPEINQRVNYPIKAALVELVDREAINLSNELHKFCISCLIGQLVSLGVKRTVNAWNMHRIPGKGVPQELAAFSRAAPVPPDRFPISSTAADMYEAQLGGRLTRASEFGRDPFPSQASRLACESSFVHHFPDLECVLNATSNHDYGPLQNALLANIRLAEQYSNQHD